MSTLLPHNENGHDDAAVLVTRGVDAIRKAAEDNRRRFLWTWLAMGLLASLIGLTLWLSIRTADSQTELAQKTANQAKQTSDETLAYLRGEQGIPGVPGASGVDGTP